MSFSGLVKQRSLKSCAALDAIEDARKILEELEQLSIDTVEGRFPDLGIVSEKTHSLREKTDHILVSLIEARLHE